MIGSLGIQFNHSPDRSEIYFYTKNNGRLDLFHSRTVHLDIIKVLHQLMHKFLILLLQNLYISWCKNFDNQ